MKKLIKIVWYSVSLLSIVVLASACKKGAEPDDEHDENYVIAVNFKDFDHAIHPLTNDVNIASGFTKLASTGVPVAADEEKILYFWSFNQRTLIPDVAVGTGASIVFNQDERTADYGPGWSHEGYAAGYSIAASAITEIVVRMPLSGIAALSELGFDMGSSNTGPKDFSLSYSQDGVNYIMLAQHNQFSNTGTAHVRHSFRYQLGHIALDFSKDLFIRITALEGNRGLASAYRESTGVTRLDNFVCWDEKG